MSERPKRPRKPNRPSGFWDRTEAAKIVSVRNTNSKWDRMIAFLRRIAGLGPRR